MKILAQIILIAGILSSLKVMEVSAAQSLQAKIDATKNGGILKIKPGVYHETLILKKSITLVGEKGVIFKDCSTKPVISINGSNITVKEIKIDSCNRKKNTPAIYISGNHNRVENMMIDSESMGIKLENSNYTNFQQINISGHGKNNGFDLWQSTHNTFSQIYLDHVQDGFYIENSNRNSFIQNRISDSRYGYHLMFSDYITIKNSVSTRNYTGAMIMGTKKSDIEDNYFTENNQNVNSQGLLLYDTHDSAIKNNHISQNRVGLFIDNAIGNTLQHNEFVANFVGAQLTYFKNNLLNNNSFMSNVSDIQAHDGANNRIQHNYWDGAMTLDTNGDGISNLPYKADPYFLNISSDTPPYQLFFQHPGMILLQKMLKSPDHLIVTDKEPLMKNPLKATGHKEPQTLSWILSSIMIFCSLFIIYIGRKKR